MHLCDNMQTVTVMNVRSPEENEFKLRLQMSRIAMIVMMPVIFGISV